MFEFFGIELDHVADKSRVFLMSCIYFSVVKVGVFIEDLSFDGLSVFIVLLLESGATGSGIVEENDVDSISTSVLVKSSFKDVKEGLAVVVGEGVHSICSGKECEESAQDQE